MAMDSAANAAPVDLATDSHIDLSRLRAGKKIHVSIKDEQKRGAAKRDVQKYGNTAENALVEGVDWCLMDEAEASTREKVLEVSV
jgi:hypothetical protein